VPEPTSAAPLWRRSPNGRRYCSDPLPIVGIIPAAGYATRLQPLRQSKEVYEVGGRPVMDYLLERMQRAPCSEVRVVTRPEKRDVIENATRHGATIVEARPEVLAESFLAGMRGLSDEDVVLLGFPDSIWEPVDGYGSVLGLLGAGWEVALGLFRATDLRRYEPVVFDESGTVTRIEFKPDHPASDWIWGCAAAPVRALRGLAGVDEPGVYFNSLCPRGVVGGVPLSDTYIDMGTRDGLREVVEMFRQRQ
jgi:NDP-sugar pyrophosphorylase family protein